MTTKFGRNMHGSVYWYDTNNTNILRERYGREFQQRGFGLDPTPDLAQIPSENLARMYPHPHKALPPWIPREDMDCVNRSLAAHVKASRAQNFGRLEVTPKVGDTGELPKSSLRVHQLEDVRYSGFMDFHASPKKLFHVSPLIRDPVLQRSLPAKSTASGEPPGKSKSFFDGTSDGAMNHLSSRVTPSEWKEAGAKIKPLPLACQTSHGSSFCDPAPFIRISGQDNVPRDNFKKKTERSQYHEASIFQNRLAPNK